MFDPPYGKPWLLYAILSGSIALNIAQWVSSPDEPEAQADAPTAEPTAEPEAQAAVAPETEEPAHEPEAHEGPQRFSAPVEHSLARTFQNALGEDGNAVSAVYARLFMWQLDLRRELQKGDLVEALYTGQDEHVEVIAAKLHSKKLGKTLHAYRFKAAGDHLHSYWDEAGVEVALRLHDSPLAEYEQITSLLRDRPNHKGMDFKVDVGTPVNSPRAGLVTRTNWNHAANGNCVEVRYEDGVVAKFLHLSRTDVRPNATVSAGETLGLSGNTGHSTAPHLHYQLERKKRVLDPVDYHGTHQRQLDADDLAALTNMANELGLAMSGSAVAVR